MSSISEIDEAVLQQLGLPTGHRLTFMRAKKELLESQAPKDKRTLCALSLGRCVHFDGSCSCSNRFIIIFRAVNGG